MKRYIYWKLTILVLIASISGCAGKSGSDDKIVMKVGNRTLSIAQLNWQYLGTAFKSPEDEFQKKSNYLQKTWNTEMAADLGIQMGLDKTVVIDSTIKAQTITNLMRQNLIKSKLNYTESDLRNYWAKYGARLKVMQIVLNNQNQADRVYEMAIKEPEKFADFVSEYSIDAAANKSGGLLDSIRTGIMFWQFDDAAFNMKPGEISKPFKTRAGWHIVKLLERHEPDLSDFTAIRPNIEATYIKYVYSKTLDQYYDELKKQDGFEVVDSTVKMMKDKLDSLQNADRQKGDTVRTFLRLNDLPDNQAKMILVKIKSEDFTAYDYLGNYKSRGISSTGVDFFNKDVIINVAFYWRNGICAQNDAIRRKIDKSEEYKNQLEDIRRAMISRKLAESVSDTITISEQEAHQFYEDNKQAEFSEPEKIRVSEILVASEPEAREILNQLAKGASFDQLVRKTIRPGMISKKGDLGYLVMGDSGVIYDEAAGLNTGQYGGPIKSYAGYSVIMVTDRTPSKDLPYENFQYDIKDYLKRTKLSEIMNALIAEHKKQIDNFLNLDLLKENLVTGKLQNAN